MSFYEKLLDIHFSCNLAGLSLVLFTGYVRKAVILLFLKYL